MSKDDDPRLTRQDVRQRQLTDAINEIFGDDLDEDHRRDLIGIVMVTTTVHSSSARTMILDVAAVSMQAEVAMAAKRET